MVYSEPDNIEYEREAEDRLEKIAIAISTSTLAVIVRRLAKIKSGSKFTEIYASMPQDFAEIEAIFNRGSKSLRNEIADIFDEMLDINDEWAKPFYDAAKVKQVKASVSDSLKPILANGKKEAQDYITKHVKTSVSGIVDRKGNPVPLKDEYKRVVSNAVSQMAISTQNYQDAVSDAVKTLSNSGIKVFYPDEYEKQIINADGKLVGTKKATREKMLTRDLYGAVRTNVMDAYRTTMLDMRLQQGREFGADGVQISAHVPCAKDHVPYQGRQFSMKSWENIQSGLPRQIMYGANCHHRISPVILGVSSRMYTREQVADMNRKSNEKVTIIGLSGNQLTMTRYEASQYQRNIENSLRKANTTRYLQAQYGEDTTALEADIKARMTAYKRISSEAGLTTRIERTKAYII